MSEGLLITARKLAKTTSQRPRQDDLKRAISTAYYALFHEVAWTNADRLIGASANRPRQAWRRTYRALNHNDAFKACGQLRQMRFPAGLVRVGDAFRSLQEQRHKADYDPTHRVTLADARDAIRSAENAIATLKAADRKDQTALAAQVLFKARP